MTFTLDLPWPWSLSPGEAVQHFAPFYLPGFLARVVVGLLVGLIVGLTTRRGNPFAGVPVLVMAAAGWLLASQPFPLLAFVIVIYLTIATYRGPTGARRSVPRVAVVLALRLIALLLTMVTLARPMLLVRTDDKVPSVLIILVDTSKSMTIKDAYDGKSRYEAVQQTLARSQSIIQRLQDENQITVVTLGFAGTVVDWDPNLAPDGPITDVGSALATAYQRFGSEASLRGLLILSDGADNGRRFSATAEAQKFRAVQCPVNGFGVGEQVDRGRDKDIAITNLVVEPAPVFIKGRMVFKATVDAIGCENADVTPRIFIDGKEWPPEKITVNGVEPDGPVRLPLTSGNELRIETTAPDTPGEMKVSLRIEPLPGEASVINNQVETFVTVSKEGIKVLLVAPLDEETKYIRQALSADQRIHLFVATRQTEERVAREAETFAFDKQAYDVIILRNVSAQRLSGGDPKVLRTIYNLVLKGTGLMMMGGFDSFGGTPEAGSAGNWNNTPIAELLPVELNATGHLTSGKEIPRVGLYPVDRGTGHYLLQIARTPPDTVNLWAKLNEKIDLRGINRLGRVKPTADLLATAGPDRDSAPVMASFTVNQGRVLAFAGDTTYLWRIFGLPDNTDGAEIHARFWKQTVLWLAHQENSEGSVWVKPDFRRLPAGQQQTFSVGVRGKSGQDLKGGRYDVRVIGPDNNPLPVPVRREGEVDRGAFWQTLAPGEYRLEANGMAIDTDGKEVTGKATVRFLVYQDERELLQTAADMDFLGKVAAAGGGRPSAYRLDDLPDFLTQLKSASMPSEKVKVERYPDWRNMKLGSFLPIWFTILVTVLCAEWALRRLWGMV